jgi:uncharacterized pyridoxal phosphate-containing UPF0001 family protein
MQQVNTRGELNKAGFSDYRKMETERGTPAIETTRQLFLDMLEVLPPCQWTRGNNSESFYVMEALTGNLHEYHARIGERYFAVVAPNTTKHPEIIAKITEALA